ncbi:MAG: hypothetical protein Q8L64_06695 [bacterium]|nr:hypothetical protein [bacterium]
MPKIYISLALALTLLIPAAVLAQWTGPTQAPPGGNVASPINISATSQTKAGGILLNTNGAAYGLIVQNGNVGIGAMTPSKKLEVSGGVKASEYCLGESCVTSWPDQSSLGIAVRSGRIVCTNKTTTCTETVTFASGSFTSTPHILVSPVNYSYRNYCRSDDFDLKISVTSKSASGFTVTTPNTNPNAGCGGYQLLQMEWIAIGTSDAEWLDGSSVSQTTSGVNPTSSTYNYTDASDQCTIGGNYWSPITNSCYGSTGSVPPWNGTVNDDSGGQNNETP